MTKKVRVRVSVGTFNLNNLFRRWNFRGAIDAIAAGGQDSAVTVSHRFDDPNNLRIRTFKSRLVQPKDGVDTQRIAADYLRPGDHRQRLSPLR